MIAWSFEYLLFLSPWLRHSRLMAIAWLLKDSRITSVLVGVSKLEQLDDNVNAVKNTQFSEAEVSKIKGILGSK